MSASSTSQLPKGWRRVTVNRITDIQDGRVDWSAVPSCNIPAEDVPKYRLTAGDLVFARTGATTGKSFLIQDCPESVFASYLIRVRVSSAVDSRYLAAFFQSPAYWQQIEGGKRGIGQPNVNGKVLGEVQFPLAPPPEQRRIVAELDALQAEVDVLKHLQAETAAEPLIIRSSQKLTKLTKKEGRRLLLSPKPTAAANLTPNPEQNIRLILTEGNEGNEERKKTARL